MSAIYREAENLLVNPGFERGSEGWEGAAGTPDTEHQDASSAGCLKLEVDDAPESLTQVIGGALAVRLRGGTLSFGVRVATESPAADAVGLWVSDDGGTTKQEGVRSMAQAGYQTVVAQNAAVGLGATEVTVGIDVRGPVVVYLDNAVACRGSAAIEYANTLSFEPPVGAPQARSGTARSADTHGSPGDEKPAVAGAQKK